MQARARLLAAAAALAWTGAAAAQAPLSAIDWLNEAPVQPATATQALPVSPAGPPEAAISVRPLDAVRADSVGLYPAGRVGLARGIWGPSTAAELAALIDILPTDTLPALRDLTYRLLLAEFEPPAPAAGPGADPEVMVRARIDALIRLGALDQAGALLDTLEFDTPALAVRHFDIRLLLGDDEAACTRLARAVQSGGPEAVAQGSLPAAAVFCQARGGDWAGAERSLAQARTGAAGLPPEYLPLLDRFIDFDSHVEDGRPGPADPPSPLAWRLLEALGEPVATQGLPLAFAHADLRGTAGWRAQIEAAERLVRSGALPPNRLIGLYTERRAAASGGIWERVRRVQALDEALNRGDPAAIGAALVSVWPQVQDGELEVAFADLFARPLMAVPLDDPARSIAATVGLLSGDYELAALGLDPATASLRLRRLGGVARGLAPDPALGAGSDAELAVLAVFGAETGDAAPSLSAASAARLAEGRVGEELLRVLIRTGASGDPRMLTEALVVLRHLGLEDIARRTALQALLLERRG